MLAISQDDLAAQSGVAKATIAAFELGQRQPYISTLAKLVQALEHSGVVFLPESENGPGVALRRPYREPEPEPEPF